MTCRDDEMTFVPVTVLAGCGGAAAWREGDRRHDAISVTA